MLRRCGLTFSLRHSLPLFSTKPTVCSSTTDLLSTNNNNNDSGIPTPAKTRRSVPSFSSVLHRVLLHPMRCASTYREPHEKRLLQRRIKNISNQVPQKVLKQFRAVHSLRDPSWIDDKSIINRVPQGLQFQLCTVLSRILLPAVHAAEDQGTRLTLRPMIKIVRNYLLTLHPREQDLFISVFSQMLQNECIRIETERERMIREHSARYRRRLAVNDPLRYQAMYDRMTAHWKTNQSSPTTTPTPTPPPPHRVTKATSNDAVVHGTVSNISRPAQTIASTPRDKPTWSTVMQSYKFHHISRLERPPRLSSRSTLPAPSCTKKPTKRQRVFLARLMKKPPPQ